MQNWIVSNPSVSKEVQNILETIFIFCIMENQYLGLELVAGKTGHDFDNKSDPDIDFYRYNINFSLNRVKF